MLGIYSLWLKLDNNRTSNSISLFVYEEIMLSSIYPSIIPLSTNSLITIYGMNFINPETINNSNILQCQFTYYNQSKLMPANYISSSQITCLSYIFNFTNVTGIEQVSVSVTNNRHTFSQNQLTLIYTNMFEIQINSVVPSFGPSSGSAITVTGVNFEEYSTIYCRFADVFHPATVLSEIQLTCRSPAIQINQSYVVPFGLSTDINVKLIMFFFVF